MPAARCEDEGYAMNLISSDYAWVLASLVGVIGSLIICLLTLLIFIAQNLRKEVKALSDKLDSKQDRTECERQEQRCRQNFDLEDVWSVINGHSHSTLPARSKVTR